MLLQNALFLFIPDIYIRGWTLINILEILKKRREIQKSRKVKSYEIIKKDKDKTLLFQRG